MIVHYDIPLIFVKSFKTASTSTEAYLEAALWGGAPIHERDWHIEENGFCSARGAGTHSLTRSQALSILVRGKFPATSISRIRHLRHHSMPDEIIPALGQKFWNRSQKIVNVRNPFDIAVSFYFFQFRDTPRAEVPSFDDWVFTFGFAPTLRWITEPDDRLNIIRYESLEADLTKLLKSLDLRPPASVPTFKTGIRPNDVPDYRSMYTKESRAFMEECFKDYLDRFEYEF